MGVLLEAEAIGVVSLQCARGEIKLVFFLLVRAVVERDINFQLCESAWNFGTYQIFFVLVWVFPLVIRSHGVLSLTKVSRSMSKLFLILVSHFVCMCFEFSKLIQINRCLDHRHRSCRYRVQVLDHFPFLQTLSKQIKTLDHLLSIRQRKIGYRHIHIARFKRQPSYQRPILLYRWSRLNQLIALNLHAMCLVRWKLCLTSLSLWLEDILAHSLQLRQHIDPLLLGDVQPLLYSVDLIIYVIIKLLVESVLYVLVEIVINMMILSWNNLLTLHHWLLLVHLLHIHELVLRCHVLRGVYRRHVEVLVRHWGHVHHVTKAWELWHVVELRRHVLNAVSKAVVWHLAER